MRLADCAATADCTGLVRVLLPSALAALENAMAKLDESRNRRNIYVGRLAPGLIVGLLGVVIMSENELMDIVRRVVAEANTSRPFYTTKEVAAMLGREPSTVREWARMGRIDAIKRGRATMIPADEVERLKGSGCELRPPKPDKVPPSQRSKYGVA